MDPFREIIAGIYAMKKTKGFPPVAARGIIKRRIENVKKTGY